MAQDLRVNRRALQRWAASDTPLPRTRRRDLARLVAARQEMLGALYRELSAAYLCRLVRDVATAFAPSVSLTS